MKAATIKKMLQWHLPLTLSLFMLVTVERQVGTDGGYAKLYGLPFPFISNAFACTWCYHVFVLPLLINLAVYLLLVAAILKLVERAGIRLKTHWSLITLGVVIAAWWIALFALITHDSFFKLTTDTSYQTTHRQLYFGVLNP